MICCICLATTTYAYAQTGATAPIFGIDQCIWFEEADGDPANVFCGKMVVGNGSLTDNGDGSFTLSTTGGGGGGSTVTLQVDDVTEQTGTFTIDLDSTYFTNSESPVSEENIGLQDIFVFNTGDTMTGNLTVSGNITSNATTNPKVGFTDSDTTDEDESANINVDCTDTGSGSEDCDVFITQQIAGASTTRMTFDADGNIVINGSFDIGGDICAGKSNGGALVTDANGVIVCEDDDSGGGGSALNFEIDGSLVSSDTSTVDFNGTRFTITEDPADDFDIDIADVFVLNTGDTMTGNLTVSGNITSNATATPKVGFTDVDTTDQDESANISVDCTDTGSGTEDCDITVNQQIAGATTTRLTFDADGNIVINGSFDIGGDICAGKANGGTVTTDANGVLICEDDDNSGGSSLNFEIDGSLVSGATDTLDFDGTDFTVTESPEDNFDIAIADDGHLHTTTSISGLDVSDDLNLVGGTSLTLTGDTLDVDDDFVKNTGDTMTGSLTNTNQVTAYNGFIAGQGTDADLTLIAMDRASADATIAWDETNDEFDFSHPINITGGGDSFVIFSEMASDPSTAADEGALYVKDVSSNTELYYRDESDGNVLQITSNGALNISDSYVLNTGDTMTGNLDIGGTLKVGGLDCTGNANGGALTATATGDIVCSDDDSAAGSGNVAFEIDGSSQSSATGTLDFDGTDFTITESPADDFDIAITDDGHSHTTTSISGLDVSDDLNLVGGTSLTLTGDTLNVDDDFVKNTGDTMTGELFANVTGALTGNADTATALAANGANCSSGNAPLGVDASGAVESCFDVWTEAENTSAGYLTTVDISDDTNLVAGDGLTLTGDTIDFDGGASPAGELGGTWASPTIDATHSGSAHHAESHTVASHSDTTATGSELETLTDGSDADSLHAHSGASLNDDIFVLNSGDTVAGNLGVTGTFRVDGSLTFAAANYTSCTALETDATGIVRCGADDGGAETNSLETTITGIEDAEIFIGNGSNSGTFVAVTSAGGDGAISNAGVLTVDDDEHNHVTTNIDSATSATWAAQITDEDSSGECAAGVFCMGGHEHAGANLTDDVFVRNTGDTMTGQLFANVTGALTGNADTSTALAANGGNCSAGSYPLGVDASGAVESCTDATTEIDSAISTHAAINDAHQDLVTLAGTPDYITLSGQVITRNTVDISDDTNIVGGNAITMAGDTINFDGGASPAGELGGTWASPTIDTTHSGSAHHAESHTVASHSDTTATGAELETLTDGSDADSLHAHSGASLNDDIFVLLAGDTMSGNLDVGGTFAIRGLDCTGNANSGALTATATGHIICSDDDGGGGSGDAVTVNSTAIDTTANFLDNTTIEFDFSDGGAGGPDDITGTLAEDSVGYMALNDLSAPADNEILSWDQATGRFDWVADQTGSSTAWDDITSPDNNGLTTITFDNGETTTFSNDLDSATPFIFIDNTHSVFSNETALIEMDFTDSNEQNMIFMRGYTGNGTNEIFRLASPEDTDGNVILTLSSSDVSLAFDNVNIRSTYLSNGDNDQVAFRYTDNGTDEMVNIYGDGHIALNGRLQFADTSNDTVSSAVCISDDTADRLFHDTDCDQTQDAGEGYIDAALSDSTWTLHNSYPTGCTNQAVTAIGDTLTCNSISTDYITDDTVGFVDITHTITLAGNPSLAANQCHPGANGIICEGTSADSIEALLSIPVTSSDKTITFQNATHTVVGRATTDTLTNKTITDSTNSISATRLTEGTVPAARVGASHIDAFSEISASIIDASGTCAASTLCAGGHTHPISTEVSGLGTGVATFLGTPSSANFASAVTGETGTGAVVFGTSPTITTSIDLPTGAINTATEISDDIITHAQMLDSDQATTKCIWFEDPTAADDFKSIWANKTANDFLLTEMWAESDQTVNLNLQVDDGTPANVNGADISPAAGEAEDTSLEGDTTVAAGEELDLVISSVSGTPTWVSICWTGNWVD